MHLKLGDQPLKKTIIDNTKKEKEFKHDTKDCYKRQRTPPHNDQCINPRRYNNCKYIYTHIAAPQYRRQILRLKRRNRQ